MNNKYGRRWMLACWLRRVIDSVDMCRHWCPLLKTRVHYSDFLVPPSERRALARTKQTARKSKALLAKEAKEKADAEKKKKEEEEMKRKEKEKQKEKGKQKKKSQQPGT